jgi:adenylate cyclase
MTNIIHEENGTLDKYEGDAIIAFWNAPLEVPKHGVKSVRVAIRCQKNSCRNAPGIQETDRKGNVHAHRH